jgi:hypothetical protein
MPLGKVGWMSWIDCYGVHGWIWAAMHGCGRSELLSHAGLLVLATSSSCPNPTR